MKETSKAMKRRWAEHDAGGFPWRDLFKGEGLDVGSGDDPLTCARPFNLPDGGGDNLRDWFEPGTQFDWIHGSQVLEHMENPALALHSWIDLVKPGGHIIATVPDFILYEGRNWPSKWNAGHRSTWSIREQFSPAEIHCHLPAWLRAFPVDVIRCELIDTNFDYCASPDIDQTLDPERGVEAFIEFVLRKPYRIAMGLSLIQWTKYTYNPWLGCRKVAPECKKCYIVRQTPLRVRGIKHGSDRHRCAESTLKEPLRWDRDAKAEGVRERVFCLSLGDWLDNEVPIEWLADLLVMIWKCQNLDWLLLTKRPQNWRERVGKALMFASENDRFDIAFIEWLNNWMQLFLGGPTGRYPSNVWIGVSAGADQAKALEIPAKIHFLSCEPMLHALDTTHAGEFDWIIFGGESEPSEPGGEPRPFDVIELDRGLKFCREFQVAPFVKQMGGAPVFSHDYFDDNARVTYGWRDDVTFPGGCTIKLSNNHGSEIEQWPERFQIRDFPKAA